MTTLLVANRGEIALRVMRTARRMGMRTVAVYSDADAGAPHTRFADVCVRIGPAPAPDSYLRRDRILAAARETGAELVHPGYGFLAEDPRFAKDCEDAGLIFVGPSSRVLALVGDKGAARRTAAEAGVPVLPGHDGEEQSDEALARAAAAVGYPVLVKPTAGGGGKGMVVVRSPDDLADALASARRVARAAVDDDRLVLERYLEAPRHVEVQVLADAHGGLVHLGERDCSLQRRHQKVMEETPAPSLAAEVRDGLHRAAVDFARKVGYVGAGTCEFLVAPDGGFGFIEMNARLQVEHPVTEMVTGLDLVELQIRVATGERLPLRQDDVRADGHAVEVRVYAEDPEEGFLPQTGEVLHVGWPDEARVDSGIEEGAEVGAHYDPLLAKLVVHGEDRDAAMHALRAALGRTEILGVRTNLSWLAVVTADAVVLEGRVTTDLLGRASWRVARDRDGAIRLAAAAEADRVLASVQHRDPWSALGPWRARGRAPFGVVLRAGADERAVQVEGAYVVEGVELAPGPGCHGWRVGGAPAAAAHNAGRWYVWWDGAAYELDVGPAPRRLAAAGPAHLNSPLPGQVIAVRVQPGDEVAGGQEIVVVEAMKMEHAIKAPADGTITAVLCAPGAQVDRGQPLADFEPS